MGTDERDTVFRRGVEDVERYGSPLEDDDMVGEPDPLVDVVGHEHDCEALLQPHLYDEVLRRSALEQNAAVRRALEATAW